MLRRHVLGLTLFSLAAVFAATRLPSRPAATPPPSTQIASPRAPVRSFAVVPRQPLPLETEAAPQLIPTEIPADCVRLLPKFKPPADIRMLADAGRARSATTFWRLEGQ
ncbi:MAG: hypothetical protein U0836_10395 [Pirellulales bacterium]